MGAWGTGLYSDDTACDVRDNYKDILGDGIEEPEATSLLLEKWEGELFDSDTGPVIWLALADTQWKLGRLQDDVKAKALQHIEDGTDLERWKSDPSQLSKRKNVLSKLKQKLNSPQPSIKEVKKRFVDQTTWKLGEVYSFKLLSGNIVLFHVIGFHKDYGGRRAVCDILDWTGTGVPNKRNLKKLGFLKANEPNQRISTFLVGSLNENEYPSDRLKLEAKRIKPKQKPGGFSAINWRDADKQLFDFFGFE